MSSNIGSVTAFHRLNNDQYERLARKNFELVQLNGKDNGVVLSKDWDPALPTVLFCHGRDGNALTGSYLNIAQDIGKHKFGGKCNVAVVLHHAPGDQERMVHDGLEAMDYITQSRGEKNVKPRDVHLCGYSIGCVTASAIANSNPQAARLTLLLPPTSFPEAAQFALKNRGLGAVGKVVSWATRLDPKNHRNTVDYIASMHGGAVARGDADVMPIEALLSRDDKVADPIAFMDGLQRRGVKEVVNVAIEAMQNSPTAHTNAFSLEKNFPQLVGSQILHENRDRTPPIQPIALQQSASR